MRILSNLEHKNSYSTLAPLAEFPENPKEGALVLKNSGLYIYVKDIETNVLTGVNIIDLTRKNLAYVHEQTEEAEEWIIKHDLKTENIIFTIYDNENTRQLEAGGEILDENTIKILFSEPIKGKACVIGMTVMAPVGDYCTKDQVEKLNFIDEGAITEDGNTVTLDLSSGHLFYHTITKQTTIKFENAPTGKNAIYSLILKNAGNYAVAFPSECKWPGRRKTNIYSQWGGGSKYFLYRYSNSLQLCIKFRIGYQNVHTNVFK